MTSLTIDPLDNELEARLRQRADAHGRSVAAEVEMILRDSLAEGSAPAGRNLADSIRDKFAPFGDFDLDLPPRYHNREPPRFGD